MPNNYAQTAITGEKWTRCATVEITNPYNRTPAVRFGEEEIINAGGETIIRQCGGISMPFDPSKTIPLIDPETGASIGSTTFGAVYVAIYSAYIAAATERDAAGA